MDRVISPHLGLHEENLMLFWVSPRPTVSLGQRLRKVWVRTNVVN